MKAKNTVMTSYHKAYLKDISDGNINMLLDILLDDNSIFTVIRYTQIRKTILQRLNYLWVYPVFIASIPFQWIFRGKIGIATNTKLGRLLFKLIGEYD